MVIRKSNNKYGVIDRSIMSDRNLTVEAKAIYAYYSSFTGNGPTASIEKNKACEDLCISEERYEKHLKILTDAGYIELE